MKVSQLKENIRNIVRQKLSEATIDVPNPANETPQTKKQKIDLARRVTGNKNLGTEKDPVEFIEEEKYTAAAIDKMSRAELIDFLGLTREEARNWSDKQLFGAARELADDKSIDESGIGDQPVGSMSRSEMLQYIGLPSTTSKAEYSDEELRDMITSSMTDLDEIEDIDLSQGFMPTSNMSQMSRQEMLGILSLDPDTPESELSDEDLRIGLKVYREMYGKLNEKDYIDDDDIVYEGVEDVDGADDSFKDYDSIYEGNFEPNVGYGIRQLSVKLAPKNPNLISISQDNGQEVIVDLEAVPELIQVLQNLYNEID